MKLEITQEADIDALPGDLSIGQFKSVPRKLLAMQVPEQPTPEHLQIQVNNRELREVSSDCINALRTTNDPPRLFVRGGQITTTATDEHGNSTLALASENFVRGELTRAANFFKQHKEGRAAVPPPLDVVRDLMARPCEELGLPAISGITATPLLRPDGSVLSGPGYDPATRMVYMPRPDFHLPPIPEEPTADDLQKAAVIVKEVFAEFPFLDEASRANTVALLLTPLLAPAIGGNRPIALIDAPQAGTGKTLIGETIAHILTGSGAVLRPAPHGSDEEWRKAITTILLEGHRLTIFDNVEGTLLAPSLALAVTANTWGDRLLGSTKDLRLSQNTQFIVTGNNIQLGGDLARRCFWIRLDSPSARPWQGREFRHPDLKGYVTQNRAELIAALLCMARAWFVRGQPKPSTPILGSFEQWSRVVGGVLEIANFAGFLGNLDDLYVQADPSEAQWASFLSALYERYVGRAFTVSDIMCAAESGEGKDGLKNLIPDGLYHEKNAAMRLGRAFLKRVNRRYKTEGVELWLQRDPEAGRTASWRIGIRE